MGTISDVRISDVRNERTYSFEGVEYILLDAGPFWEPRGVYTSRAVRADTVHDTDLVRSLRASHTAEWREDNERDVFAPLPNPDAVYPRT